MTLPDLPRQLKRKEVKSSILFRHKLPELESCTIEMKDTRGKDYLNFSEVKDQQIAHALGAESDKGILIRNTGGNGEPDYTWHRNQPAYIVIRYPKVICMVRIKDFLHARSSSTRKSLTSAMAVGISELVIRIKR